MRESAVILDDMRQVRKQLADRLAELAREYASALFQEQTKALIKKPRRWHGPDLEALRDEYENTPRTLGNLADRHRTSAGNISNLAKMHDWKRRELHRRLQPRSAATPVELRAAE